MTYDAESKSKILHWADSLGIVCKARMMASISLLHGKPTFKKQFVNHSEPRRELVKHVASF